MNVEKQEQYGIGSKHKSNRKMCEEYKLDWSQMHFKVYTRGFTNYGS